MNVIFNLSVSGVMGMPLPIFLIVLLLGIVFTFVKDEPMVESAFTSIKATLSH